MGEGLRDQASSISSVSAMARSPIHVRAASIALRVAEDHWNIIGIITKRFKIIPNTGSYPKIRTEPIDTGVSTMTQRIALTIATLITAFVMALAGGMATYLTTLPTTAAPPAATPTAAAATSAPEPGLDP